ncbi:MAG: DNA cytosine methyltransferase [Nesterenkonia sp.]
MNPADNPLLTEQLAVEPQGGDALRPAFDDDLRITAVDQFAGPGGWSLAAQDLDIDEIGIEYDDAANATRRACGYKTIEADILTVAPFPAYLLISSPACQPFSVAGKGAGRQALDQVLENVDALAEGAEFDADAYDDVRTALVLMPLVWVLKMHTAGTPYRRLAFEQVPPVRPVWDAMLTVFETLGYRGEVGVVQSESLGVAQTRKRAILVASLDHHARLPAPTHSKYYPRNPEKLDPGVEKWVSMAEALGWGMTQRPTMTVTGGGAATGGAEPIGNGGRQSMLRERAAGRWAEDRPEKLALRNNTSAKATVRDEDTPAPTMYFGARLNSMRWEPGGSAEGSASDEPVEAVKRMGTGMIERHGDRPGRGVDKPAFSIRAGAGGMEPGGFRLKLRSNYGTGGDAAKRGERGQNYPAPAVTSKADRNKWVADTDQQASAGAKITPAKKPVLRPSPYAGMLFNGGGRPMDANKPAPVMTASAGGNRTHIVDESGGEFIEDYHAKVAAGQQPPPMDGAPLRRLTIEEAKILQSFPADYPLAGSKTKQFQQVGNAVPPLLARHVLKTLIEGDQA